MNIEHIALWVEDLERMKEFYTTFFKAQANAQYHNPTKQFKSYFLSFAEGARMEIMNSPHVTADDGKRGLTEGLAHFAMSVGSEQEVRLLTDRIRTRGYEVVSEPRTTGDGYYESVVLDPEGNYVEITV